MSSWQIRLNSKMYDRLVKDLVNDSHYEIEIVTILGVPVIIDDGVPNDVAELRHYE